MCSFHICPAYDNIKSTIRLYDGVLFVTLKNQKDGSDVHITLNPSQASTLGEYLQVAGRLISAALMLILNLRNLHLILKSHFKI